MDGVERDELLPEALARRARQVGLERSLVLEAVDQEIALPAAIVLLLEAAALRPQEARLADHLRHVLALEPVEIALTTVGRHPSLDHVENRRVHRSTFRSTF